MRRTGLYVLLMIFLFGSAALTNAQDASNLLRDGSFEGQYTGRRATGDLNIPADWGLWQAQGSADQFINRADKTFAFPHTGPDPSPHGGSRALNLSGGYVTFSAAVYQQVTVTQGTPVQASAWAWLHTCNLAPNAEKCGSAVESGAFTRIGIDPNGGTDPFDTDIVWSAESRPHDQWLQITVSATPTAGTVTLFLYVTQASPSQLNNVYWDDAVLAGGGAGGAAAPVAGAATAAPPPPVEVGFVVAQAAQDDGSIIHTVIGGDTVDSIAVAYGVTRADILALNNISDPRIIAIGQRLIIKPADAPADSAPETGSGESPDAAAAEESAGEQPVDAAAPTADVVVPAEGVVSAENDAPVEVSPAAPTSTPAPAPVVSVANGVLPAIDPGQLNAALCVTLFEDFSPNTIREDGENALAGGTIEVRSAGQSVASQPTTDAADPLCFTELAAGDYVIAAAAPAGYGLTTPDELNVKLLPGIDVSIEFGAAQGFQPAAVLPADAESGGLVSDVAAEETDARALTDQLFDVSGLLMFGLAGLVLVGGLGLTLLSRRH